MEQTTESFLRIEAIFHEALAVPDHAKKELIETLCKGDRSLADEVYSLLEACNEEEAEAASRRLNQEAGWEIKSETKRIGPYLLDSLLGRGGMGAVYLAHRADGQFEQKVAIKLIDLPLATDLFRERFRQERQILAGLQHPYIARLLDGGVTQDGDLYLAMEYVDGVPIDRFCESRDLSVSQRLALFMHVCEAVQFAHQNLVVHRDLKPDNIFVAEDSTPRLLDFGTAKLLSPSHDRPASELTREGFQSFTPQYASPEQVLGNPITTASDTYSLGVLLYLLLTETLPYELKELTTAEMLRVVCEEPPRRPPQAVGSHMRLDTDLEAILMKALRKEPPARYLTAEQLASDIRAYLDGKPVAARHASLPSRKVHSPPSAQPCGRGGIGRDPGCRCCRRAMAGQSG
jgi:eukaryotic-like serine/threonine-protein kinase